MKGLVTVLLVVGLGIGAYVYFNRPLEIPDLVMKDADGGQVNLDDMLGDKEALLLVVLLPGCTLSRFSLEAVKAVHDRFADRLAVVGLLAGNNSQAQQYAEQQQVSFPVYGVRSAADPFAVNELIEKIGESGCGRATVRGGTVAVIDREHMMLLRLEGKEVRNLGEQLDDLL